MLKILKYKCVLLLGLAIFLISCDDFSSQINQENKVLKKEILSLERTIDSLELQIKKCDNWVNLLEEE